MVLKQSLLENHSVLLNAEATTWQEAVQLGTDLLVKSNAVTPDYYHAILRGITQFGPYIIIAPNFAIPHARPEDGVNRTAFAVVTLKHPVEFDGGSSPVDVLVTLAAKDATQHLEGLREITQLIEDENSETGVNLDKFRRCQNELDFFTMLDQTLNG